MAGKREGMRSAELDQQWREVEREHPLVAEAYRLQQKELARIAIEYRAPFSKQFRQAVLEERVYLDKETALRVGINMQDCIQNFLRAIARSEEYDPSISEEFSNCWKNASKIGD